MGEKLEFIVKPREGIEAEAVKRFLEKLSDKIEARVVRFSFLGHDVVLGETSHWDYRVIFQRRICYERIGQIDFMEEHCLGEQDKNDTPVLEYLRNAAEYLRVLRKSYPVENRA